MKPLAKRGFTLVEIMIVVAIIALLAAIAIPNVLRGRTTANEAAAIGNMRALVSSLEMYRSVNNVYPNATAGQWQTDMYNNATPDFGPPSFNVAMTGQTVQSFNWTYAGVAAGTTYTVDTVPSTPLTTGTRRFHTDESALIRHCNCPDVTCATPAAWANEATIDATANSC